MLPDGESWHPVTVEWWAGVRQWAFLADEPAWSWAFLVDTALLHHTMWTRGRHDLASEIRLRSAKYAQTPEDRLKLRVTLLTPSDETGSVATGTGAGDEAWRDARRRRLTES